ncbi:P-loop NTPase superfamily protein [Organic Lake phycodnavirus 2]|jgi:ATP-dependent DNA helicase PIF1|nr:P-loop NTPase superfamily protein [Organic Lake phycodnavirus 2]
MNTFSESQQSAYKNYLKGENVFITGPGGTGKSYFIKKVYEDAKSRGLNVSVTAMTGCAALLLDCNAKTIHSWGSIGLGTEPIESIKQKIVKYRKRDVWIKTDLLIIDEVSMLSCELFELLYRIAQDFRRSEKPFGNMQLIFSGDFHQLPPVSKDSKFCFESPFWNGCFQHKIVLKENFRQKGDKVYQTILNEIREGNISEESKDILRSCLNKKNNEHLSPTLLYPVKRLSEQVNLFENISLKGEEKLYKMKYIIQPTKKIEQELIKQKRNLIVDEELRLKIGSQVMCAVNLDQEQGIINGSQGKVIGFNSQNEPIVKFFYKNIIRTISLHKWMNETYDNNGILQLPLILSWAITIHKSQGISLECANINIGSNIFECGQSYVALSRVKSLEGLYIQGLDFTKIKSNPKVIDFYKSIN